ncbi:MAG: hypothetical protein IKY61_05190 [Thermoguttaceae bacterium]|nr:hypothetical protein [Thermoguttaceae bacterium]
MLGALISAFVLCCVIRKVVDQEVEMGKAFSLELLAALVGLAATGYATAPISTTSMGACLCVGLAIHFVLSIVVVQLLCYANVKTVLKIVSIYFPIKVVFIFVWTFLVVAAVAAAQTF